MTNAATDLLAHWLGRLSRQHLSGAILAEEVDAGEFCSGNFQAQLARLAARHAAGKPPHRRYQHPASYSAGSSGWRLGWFDDNFPQLLRHIPDPPLLLYGQGDRQRLQSPAVAVVGARRCTTQGRRTAENLSQRLATAGLTVVSGLAYGIDAAAHRGALLGNGNTAAVLGGGLNRLYPAAHVQLSQDIVQRGGVLVSEYPPQVAPRPHHFLERNRLISGLSRGTLVVEAGKRSGSLSTARFAMEQGRDVMAVPGPIGSAVSQGCHDLIQQGAALVTSVEDVFALLDDQSVAFEQAPAPSSTHMSMSDMAAQVFAQLQGYPKTVDELVVELAVPGAALLAALTELELAGIVEQGPVGYIATS